MNVGLFTPPRPPLWRGRALRLTADQAAIVALLADRAGGVVAYREIYDAIRGPGYNVGADADGMRTAARNHISRIRRAFLAADPDFSAIVSHYGVGYAWIESNEQPSEAA